MCAWKREREIPFKEYREHLGRLDDSQLKKEWETVIGTDECGRLEAVKHEMALRFLGKSESQKDLQDTRAYFWDKLLEEAESFGKLVAAGEFFQAKYLYEKACMLTVFLEMPEELRRRLFGTTTEDDVYVEGLFAKKDINLVMSRCVVWNRLGYDCLVYRIPGEAGYHGARAAPGVCPDRQMKKEENPAYLQEASGQ